MKPMNLVNPFLSFRYVRATPGGCGYTKMGSNYAPTLWVQKARINIEFRYNFDI